MDSNPGEPAPSRMSDMYEIFVFSANSHTAIIQNRTGQMYSRAANVRPAADRPTSATKQGQRCCCLSLFKSNIQRVLTMGQSCRCFIQWVDPSCRVLNVNVRDGWEALLLIKYDHATLTTFICLPGEFKHTWICVTSLQVKLVKGYLTKGGRTRSRGRSGLGRQQDTTFRVHFISK